MITVYPVLRQRMTENHVTIKDLASVTEMSRTTLILSMLGIRKWRLTEVVKICCLLKDNNVNELFVRFNFKRT